MANLKDLVEELVLEHDIEVTIQQTGHEIVSRLTGNPVSVVYDLGTNTKSWIWLVEAYNGERIFAVGRYGECEEVDDVHGLAYIYVDRVNSRPEKYSLWGTSAWNELAVKIGALTKTVKTVVEYS